MKNKAIGVGVVPRVYSELLMQLKQTGDQRHPDEVVNLAIKDWLVAHGPGADRGGYQWKDLFLPNGTELRMRYQGDYYYAHIAEDELHYANESMSPCAWTRVVTGTVRNAWRAQCLVR